MIGILLFIGAMGKSAQLGLHPWLADAMEGPTPVSALIHAATMVTAGVFLMVRMSPLLEYAPVALAVVGIIGGTTAVFAATIGCAQTDIKRVIAYSTCSQLGYMFVAVSVGAYQASIFHLIMHAFFKALLFLTAGSVIHAMSGEQDMRKMGGLARLIPYTYVMMWIGGLALAGIPPLSGFFSKDAIIDAAFCGRGGGYACICVELATYLTAFYTWRMIFMTFHGPRNGDAHVMAHVHESPWVMRGPLARARPRRDVRRHGLLDHYFIGADQRAFWNGSISTVNDPHILTSIAHVPLFIDIPADGAGPARHRHGLRDVYAEAGSAGAPGWRVSASSTGCCIHKYYVDELYGVDLRAACIARCARAIWHVGDEEIIDGIPRGGTLMARGSAGGFVRLQSGSLAQYAFVMLIGLVVLISVFLIFR